MSNTDLIRHLRAEHSKHYDALGDLLFDAARALEAAEAERTYFDEDTLRKVYDALDTTSMPNAEIENAINAMQNAGILFRERLPESSDPVHWGSDAPTSLHGNGASSFERTTRDAAKVTCKLCLTLLARESGEPS